MKNDIPLQVIIMAGGLGKRMKSELPKVLHEIDGTPMLVHVIKQSQKLNPDKIIIVVGKYKLLIQDTIANFIDIHSITFVEQVQPKGTGDAIKCCIYELMKMPLSNVLILSGDIPLLSHITMKNVLNNLNNVKIVTTDIENPSGYGRIVTEYNVFIKIVEEKDCDLNEKQITKINCGIYAFDTNLLCKYLPTLDNNNSQAEYYLTDIIEKISNEENIEIEMYNIPKVKQFEISGVNTPEQLTELEKYYKKMN